MSLGFASLVCGVDLQVMRHEPEAVRPRAESHLKSALAQGSAVFENHARLRRGWARVLLGEIESGMGDIQQGLAITRPYQLHLRANLCPLPCSRPHFSSHPGPSSRSGVGLLSDVSSAQKQVAPAGPPAPTGNPPACTRVGQTLTRLTDGTTMVCVPAGEFLMGSTDADPHAKAGEKPQHIVYLDAFWIDQTEVTDAQYRFCVDAGACQEPPRFSLSG
jgi:formylglycine-generating enzyme required for sulfatase activity